MSQPDPVVSVLRRARGILERPEAWVQKAPAVTRDGEDVETNSPAAVAFCVGGAIERAIGEPGTSLYRKTITALNLGIPHLDPHYAHHGYIAFNDAESTTHADVLAALDRAIELREREMTDA